MPKEILTVTIDKELLVKLRKCAKKENRTLSNMVETIIKKELENNANS